MSLHTQAETKTCTKKLKIIIKLKITGSPFGSPWFSPYWPGPGWDPVRVGARSGLGPIWARARMGPYGPDFALKIINSDKNDKIVNKNRKGVKSEKIKIKTWFCDKELSSLNSIN